MFAFGCKEGKGKFIFADNSEYVGNFTDNKIDGYGVYSWSDGR